MNETEIEDYCRRLQLPEAGVAILRSVNTPNPARRVGSHVGNRTNRYPSRKNNFVVQAESCTVELPYVYKLEYDDRVIGYYDQPTTITLSYVAKSGRRTGARHKPDFLALLIDGPEFVECKSEEELVRLAEEMPNRYQRSSGGGWICPPGEEAVREFGFRYRVVSSAELNPIFTRNITFMADYFDERTPDLDAPLRVRMQEVIGKRIGISIKELLDEIADTKPEDIYTLIGHRHAFVDLYQAPIVDWDHSIIFSSPEMARTCQVLSGAVPQDTPAKGVGVVVTVGTELSWHDRRYTVLNHNISLVVLTTEGQTIQIQRDVFDAAVARGEVTQVSGIVPTTDPKLIEAALAATPEELAEAHRRYKTIQAGDPKAAGITTRTLDRWLKDYREAEAVLGCGFLGLIPKARGKGNRTQRFPDAVYELANKVIQEEYLTFKQKRRIPVYARFRNECQAIGQSPPSYQWFCQRIRSLDSYQAAKSRTGRRGAYRFEPRSESTGAQRTCDRPFERVHVDHTELDLQLVSSATGKPIRRPWLTLAIDEKTRRVLAYYVTYEAPGYVSCMGILREMVRIHNRFPACLIVDNAKEFSCCDFEMLAARYEMAIEKRPRAKGRFGSVIERMFGTINTQLLYQLWGNTQATKVNARTVTKSNDPARLACWTLAEFDRVLRDYLARVYDTAVHPALGMSPAEAFRKAMEETGSRPVRVIPYDEGFLVWCLPSTRTGLAKVQPRDGVKVNHLYYWSDAFEKDGVKGSKVRVKVDPHNAGIVYALVKGRWERCVSQYHHFFNGRSRKEIQIASDELRQSKAGISANTFVTAKKLLDFMAGPEELERLKQQREKDKERQLAAPANDVHKAIEIVVPFSSDDLSSPEVPESPSDACQYEEIGEVQEI